MSGNKPRSSYKKKGKVFMVSDLRREIEKSTLRTEQSNMTTTDVRNETNSKASEFPISVSKRKLSHEMTQLGAVRDR